MRGLIAKRRTRVLLVIVGLVLCLWLVIVSFLPELVRNKAAVAAATGRELRIEQLSINPLTLGIEILRAELLEADGAAPFASFERLRFQISLRSLLEGSLVLEGLELEQPRLSLVRRTNGRFNFSDLLPAPVPAGAPQAGTEPFRFAVLNLVVRDGAIDFVDLREAKRVHRVRELELALPFIGNTPALAEEFVEPRFRMLLDDAVVQAVGSSKPFHQSLETSLRLSLNGIDLPFYAGYLPAPRPVEVVSGRLALELELSYRLSPNAPPEMIVKGGLTLTGVRLRDHSGAELLFLPLMQVAVARIEPLKPAAVIDAIDLYGLELFVSRAADGRWNLERLAQERPAGETLAAETASLPRRSAPDITLNRLRLRNGQVQVSVHSDRGVFRREVRDLRLDLSGLTLAGGSFDYELGMSVLADVAARNGEITARGTAELEPFGLEASLATRRLQLEGLEHFLPPELQMRITRGHLDTDLVLALRSAPSSGQLSGSLGIRALELRDSQLNSDILSWESLQCDGINLSFLPAPPAVALKQVALTGLRAGILISPEGKVNLQHLYAPPAPVSAAAAPAPVAPAAGASPLPAVRVESFVLQNGTLAFADYHLRRPFVTTLRKLGGRISGFDTRTTTPAEIDLRGSLENHSPLRISGTLAPLGERLQADIALRFSAIDLAPATPYAGTYLGYAIEKGKLSLDLAYRIDGRRLVSSNRIFLDQFTFGERVESEQATTLPVRLAVALLKDRRGQIHLDLPVTGSLDDPQFSVLGVVFTMLKNLLVKAATAPFALLASLFGGGEEFSAISFPPGSAVLSEAERVKLARIATMLTERPTLKLEVSGQIDAERDPEGYRRQRLEDALRTRKLREWARAEKLPPGTRAEALELTPAERSRYLSQVYAQADFPKPRNILGIAKSMPDEEMEKLILANIVVGPAELKLLARARATAVIDQLVAVEGLPVERIFLSEKGGSEAGGQGGSQVVFGLAAE